MEGHILQGCVTKLGLVVEGAEERRGGIVCGVRWLYGLKINTIQKARRIGILARALAELYLWDHWIILSCLLNHLLL